MNKPQHDLGLEIWKGPESARMHFRAPLGGRVLCRVGYNIKGWLELPWEVLDEIGWYNICNTCMSRSNQLLNPATPAAQVGSWYWEAKASIRLLAKEGS